MDLVISDLVCEPTVLIQLIKDGVRNIAAGGRAIN